MSYSYLFPILFLVIVVRTRRRSTRYSRKTLAFFAVLRAIVIAFSFVPLRTMEQYGLGGHVSVSVASVQLNFSNALLLSVLQILLVGMIIYSLIQAVVLMARP